MNVVHLASNKTEPPSLPHTSKVPRRFNTGENPHYYSFPKDKDRHIFFEVLKVVFGEVERRFEESNLPLAQEMESFHLFYSLQSIDNIMAITDCVSKFREGDI